MCCLETLRKHDVTAQAIWSPNGQNSGDSHKNHHKSGKIIDKETLTVTVLSPQFALWDCPEKGFCPPSLDTGHNVGFTLVCWEILPGVEWGPGLSGRLCQGCSRPAPCPLGIHTPNRWVKTVRGWERAAGVVGVEGGECRAGDGRVGGCHSRGHCCPSARVFHGKEGTGGKKSPESPWSTGWSF